MEEVTPPARHKGPVVYKTRVLNRIRLSTGTYEIGLGTPMNDLVVEIDPVIEVL